MWSTRNGRKILDLNKVNSKNFRTASQDGFTLVCPKKNMWEWAPEERWLRSVVVDDTGAVVSCGWPKFGNYGEFADDTAALDRALADGDVLFTMKHDGSLCIRSVFGGKVVFRTRGTLLGGDYDEEGNEPFGVRFRKVAEKKYSVLLDPFFCCDRSLLFEYVSPDNKIVISYDQEDLIFLGCVHHDLRLGSWVQAKLLAATNNLNLVETHELPRDPVHLLAEIKDWEDEGVVARCGQVFVKVKSAAYLCKHRAKSNMGYNFIVEYVALSGIESEEQLVKELSVDLDFETVSEGVKFYRIYKGAIDKYEECLSIAREEYEKFETQDGEDDRARKKRYAMEALKQDPIIRPMMFALYDDKPVALEKIRRGMIVREGKR